MDELIQMIARQTGISSTQAARAVICMLSYLAARLPSPLMGRIREQLCKRQEVPRSDVGDGAVG